MTSDKILKIKNVSKTFKIPKERKTQLKHYFLNPFHKPEAVKFDALKNISFEVKTGEFLGIIGRNGSGKSTLLKLIAGIYQPDKGEIKVNGKITPFLELGVGFNPELSARENIFLNGTILGMTRKYLEQKFDEIVDFAEIREFIDMPVKNFSSGMQVRLAFAIAIQSDADIYLVDEVLAVGDASFQKKCLEIFEQFKRENKTVIFVSHSLEQILRFCDKAILLDERKIVFDGKTEDTIEHYHAINPDVDIPKIRKEKSSIKKITEIKKGLKKPNLFLVGASKSGTTAIWSYLSKHPEVYVPDGIKETCFFSDFGKQICPMTKKEYLARYSNAEQKHKYLLDASNAYLQDPLSAKKIYKFNKDAKIIIILRNPADRAYSLYNFMTMKGLEYIDSFEKALENEDTRMKKKIPNWFEPHSKWNYRYFNSGLYFDKVKLFVDLFKKNVLVLKYEDFQQDNQKTMDVVSKFLNIKNLQFTIEKHNVSRLPMNPQSQFIFRECIQPYTPNSKYGIFSKYRVNIKRTEFFQEYIQATTKLNNRQKITMKCIISSMKIIKRYLFFNMNNNHIIFPNCGFSRSKNHQMNPRVRFDLLNKYKDDIKNLSNLTKIDFKSWLNES